MNGLFALYRRRLAVAKKSSIELAGLMALPALWILAVAPALDDAVGDLAAGIDYFTFLAVSQVVFLVPFTSMFSGINVLVDRESGVLRELLVAPVRRALIPIADALAVATVAGIQVSLIVLLAVGRNAAFHTSPTRLLAFAAAAALLSLTTYGLAESLALLIGRQDAYGPAIPAVGVTPFFLAGTLFPISALPAGFEQFALALPWTHAVAVMRYGLMQGTDSGLGEIWGQQSEALMAVFSLVTLVAFTAFSLLVAIRIFKTKSLA